MPLRDGGRSAGLIVSLAVVAVFIVLSQVLGAGVRGSGRVPLRSTAAAWRGLAGGPRPQAAVDQRMIVVLRAPSLAQSVARAGGLATDEQERQWTAAAYAAQKELIANLGAHGLQLALEYSYARVLNGFSAALDTEAAALLERSDQVAGVYPVRAAYPATVTAARLGAAAGSVSGPDSSLPGFDGRGVTIALLDTGVDRTRPFLHGHVLAGYDVLGTARTAAAQSNPFDAGEVERHGTEMAGILVGSGGPAGAHGVASGATVLPIRVAGWQLDARGEPAVLGRTDQLIAGLERAVDPNDDGDAHDAARIALLPLSEPYAAFSDSPEARAVEGALGLDTLVVAAAGNDGPAGPDFGSISGPGGAAGALTVGAADTRTLTEEARVVLRTGLHVGFDRRVPLAGSALPTRRVEGELAAPRGGNGTLAGMFDRRGFSLVAGRIALLPAGKEPAGVAEAGARAGADAVVLYGRTVPAGAIGLRAGIGVPVVSIPTGAALPMLAAIRSGRPAVASIGAPQSVTNNSAGRPAPFSSRGLAFDGRLKPDVLAPGVSILTSEPEHRGDGASSFGSVSGSSAAAAVVAGAAAVLAQARPSLGAAELRRLLIGTGRPVAGESAAAQGTGLVDLGGGAAAELAVDPPTLALGRVRPGRAVRRTIVLRSLSPRRLRVYVGSELEGRADQWTAVKTPPRRVLVPPNGTTRVAVTVLVNRVPNAREPVIGMLDLSTFGGDTVRTPLTFTLDHATRSLIRDATVSARSFEPSDTTPARLSVSVGRITRRGAVRLEPVERLDLKLATGAGTELGLLARLRDLLPGRYVFGLTGRGPDGSVLDPGRYRLTIVAIPTDVRPASQKQVDFWIK